MTFPTGIPRGGRFRRLRRYAPLPLVAVTVLLLVLILITPVLISTGQPAPGILTQADLIVDRVSGNGTMHFYVTGVGTTTRYTSIWVGVAIGFNWTATGPVPWSKLNWTNWQNESDVITVVVATTANPVALNVTAYYVSPGGSAVYAGIVAFYVSISPGSEVLNSASATSGVTVLGSQPVDNSTLPYPIPLAKVASGGP
jgi:hypothetical protein